MQSPVATKEDQDDQPEGGAKGSTGKGPDPASSQAQTTAWNPFKSRARVPLPPEPMPIEEDEQESGDGKKGDGRAKGRRSAVAVPSDHEILTSLPPDKIWENMQQHASEGMLSLHSVFRDTCCFWLPSCVPGFVLSALPCC